MTKKTNSKSEINVDKSNAKTFYLDKQNLVPYANSLINNGKIIMKEKGKRKIKIYFSMDPDLYEVFEKHIDENLYDKSKVIEKLIDDYIQKKLNFS